MPSVTRNPGQDRGTRRARVQAQLFAVLDALLASGVSFTAITVDRLLTESGVARSTFYLYYPDKTHLLAAITEDLTEEYMAACQDWWHLSAGATRADLASAIRRMFEAYWPHRLLMRALIEAATYDLNVRAGYLDHVNQHIGLTAEHIRRGQRDGLIDSRVAAVPTSTWLCWMIDRGLYELGGTPAAEGAVERYVSTWTDIVWHTLYGRAR